MADINDGGATQTDPDYQSVQKWQSSVFFLSMLGPRASNTHTAPGEL